MSIKMENGEELFFYAVQVAPVEAHETGIQVLTLDAKSSEILIPKIGSFWEDQFGVYAGMMRSYDGRSDFHLVVGRELIPTNWGNSLQQAADVRVAQYADFTLPSRKEQALMFANVPELFESAWYWSCEQIPTDLDYAWAQDFANGFQDDTSTSFNCRSRVVRRVYIQEQA